MKKKAIITVAVIIAAVAAAGVLTVMHRRGTGGDEVSGTDRRTARSAPLVLVAGAVRDTMEQIVGATGTVRADVSAGVVAQVSGRLERLRLEDGTSVQAGLKVESGQKLAAVERRHVHAALREAQAALAEARAALEEAGIRKEDAQREKNRMVALHGRGVVTSQTRDQAVTAYRRARAAVDMTEKRVERAQAAFESARLRYEDAVIEAPIRGVVSRTYVDEGSYVAAGTRVLSIINTDHVDIEGVVAERHLPRLQAGQTPVRVRVDAYPDEVFEGRVSRVAPELDAATRTVQLTVRLSNPQGRLQPGMFARVDVVLQRRDNVVVVPEAALVPVDDGFIVFVIDDARVSRRDVHPGLRVGDRVEIREGLSAGETVAVRGHHLLEDGLLVEVRENRR